MQPSQHSTTEGFLALVARLHPGLNGAAVSSGASGLVHGAVNTEVIEVVHTLWATAYPEAGQPYSAVRTWTLLIWQPVFLSVAGVHGASAVAPVDRLWQRVEQGVVAGFELPQQWPAAPDSETERIQEAAARLLRVRDGLLADLKRVTLIKPVIANRLMADILLMALQRMAACLDGVDNERLQSLGQAWLAATGLREQSRYLPLQCQNGQHVLGLERRACCMHYRRDDGAYCSSCPKLAHSERARRQLEELSHEAVAD